MRAEATPVPIPNTTVKIRAADGTILETIWESRRLPDIFNILKKSFRAVRKFIRAEQRVGFFKNNIGMLCMR